MSVVTLANRRAGGPVELVLVRHGQSLGNLANDAALAAKAHRLDSPDTDERVALSPQGQEQADALAEHLAGLPDSERPTVVVSSPYARAHETAQRALARLDLDIALDERLRERELGAFDGVTWYGIKADFPEESARRDKVGKFYYRPPSGESWADVIFRVRSVLADVFATCEGERVWIFTHEAVILAFRYVLEGLDAEQVVELQKTEPIANTAMTRYVRQEGRLQLVKKDDTAPLEAGDAEVTRSADENAEESLDAALGEASATGQEGGR